MNLSRQKDLIEKKCFFPRKDQFLLDSLCVLDKGSPDFSDDSISFMFRFFV